MPWLPPAFTGPPIALDIEWLISGEDMANLMRRIRDLDDPTAREIMAVDTSVPDNLSGDWHYIGYKGGSHLRVDGRIGVIPAQCPIGRATVAILANSHDLF